MFNLNIGIKNFTYKFEFEIQLYILYKTIRNLD